MPQIFDNIEEALLPAIKESIRCSYRADICVGYFNLRGWRSIAEDINAWNGGENNCCRLLIGMQYRPNEELKKALSPLSIWDGIDTATAVKLKRQVAEDLKEQLTFGIPNDGDESSLHLLSEQLKAGKVVVKLFLRYSLHAKLYLFFRQDKINPIVGYLGSSNLTFAGLKNQGELNIDVLDKDAGQKLSQWFDDRWHDRWCLDISKELVNIIENSWARIAPIPPYYIYLKMAYHLSNEARAGITEFAIPRDFNDKLLEFQKAAVKIAAYHLNKRGGVLIGDVVGLGKTLMAAAVARIMEEDLGLETLIICPKNLVAMWEDYRQQFHLHALVVSLSMVNNVLPGLRRHRVVIIDESHNLRNREGKRFRAIQEYIEYNESKCILLSATPYNKNFLDLSNQLRLFIKDEEDLGIRPERLLREIGELEFLRRHQCPVRSLLAFEKSTYPDDWRELMRLYLVRRTRSFIQANYSEIDPVNGRKFISFADGTRSYFPERVPKTIKYVMDNQDDPDPYDRLYSIHVVNIIDQLTLPRYGLGNYIEESPRKAPSSQETRILKNLSRAGKRLMGFCRINLFKRLESSGIAFIQSIERHILRNYIYLYALENNLDLPIGAQEASSLDTWVYDGDIDSSTNAFADTYEGDTGNNETGEEDTLSHPGRSLEEYKTQAASIYHEYKKKHRSRCKWLRSDLFNKNLEFNLALDAQALFQVLAHAGEWLPDQDKKLAMLFELLNEKHSGQKVIIFSQYADTVRYLEKQLKARGIEQLAGVTGDSPDPAALVWRFSPVSSGKSHLIDKKNELRILISTDVLSEGQNLQDCSIVVNYDLPWAIIRLIQRLGRVDRLGQKSDRILCYSFLPAKGVERIIRLRARIRLRLWQNAEVVGTDEEFFEEDRHNRMLLDIYNENTVILDTESDSEVDLASYAYQIWKNAISENPQLEKIIPVLQPVVYSTRQVTKDEKTSEGVLVYMRTPRDNDALMWMNAQGNSITESQRTILEAAACAPDTPAASRRQDHHELLGKAVETILNEEHSIGGQLGRPSSARFRVYERLRQYADQVRGTFTNYQELILAIDDVYCHPLRQSAVDTLNRQIRSGIDDETLARLVIELREENRLCIIHQEEEKKDIQIICSLGLKSI